MNLCLRTVYISVTKKTSLGKLQKSVPENILHFCNQEDILGKVTGICAWEHFTLLQCHNRPGDFIRENVTTEVFVLEVFVWLEAFVTGILCIISVGKLYYSYTCSFCKITEDKTLFTYIFHMWRQLNNLNKINRTLFDILNIIKCACHLQNITILILDLL